MADDEPIEARNLPVSPAAPTSPPYVRPVTRCSQPTREMFAIYKVTAPLPLSFETRLYGTLTLDTRSPDYPPFSMIVVNNGGPISICEEHFWEPGRAEFVLANGFKVDAGSLFDRVLVKLVELGKAEVVWGHCTEINWRCHCPNRMPAPDARYWKRDADRLKTARPAPSASL